MIFPFGQEVRNVVQKDRKPKKIFCLGVYGSAVHAKWVGPDGEERCQAMAVASEPEIFWDGISPSAEKILKGITIPAAAGKLTPPETKFNGPSGLVLNEQFIAPLRAQGKQLSREDFWLCDLVPHSFSSKGQQAAISKKYLPKVKDWGLPIPTIEPVPYIQTDKARVAEILSEVNEGKAKVIMLLGDQPIKEFLCKLVPELKEKKSLRQYGADNESYGRLHEVHINNSAYHILPLVHPRQAGGLGDHSAAWSDLHSRWMRDVAPTLLGNLFPPLS